MKRTTPETNKYIRNALIFVLGVIVTVIITKLSDKVVPNDPVIVKQYTDTVKILHEYVLPKQLNNDSTRLELEKKVKNLELLNNYEKQIKERITQIDNDNSLIPNLILTQNSGKLKQKGYMQGSSSSYFSSNCPDLNNKYLDIYLDFLNSAITKEIAFLRVNIYKFENKSSTDARTYVLEDFYEVRSSKNFIRINNDFGKGKYEILFGFMFKNEVDKQYPTFYMKKCIVLKE